MATPRQALLHFDREVGHPAFVATLALAALTLAALLGGCWACVRAVLARKTFLSYALADIVLTVLLG